MLIKYKIKYEKSELHKIPLINSKIKAKIFFDCIISNEIINYNYKRKNTTHKFQK
jgi:hypothetical protein